MAEKLTIANWAEEDKPREKLERLGASALSNAELLGILIGSGSTDESAVDLMKRILKDCDNNLNQLGKKTIRELTQKPSPSLLPANWASAVLSIRLAHVPT